MIVIINDRLNDSNIDVSKMICEEIENSIVYNPYEVAMMLDNILEENIKENFEAVDIWNKLVIEIAKEIKNKYQKHLIIPARINSMENFNWLKNNLINIDSEVYAFNFNNDIDDSKKEEDRIYCNISVKDKDIDNIKSIIINKIRILSSEFLNNELLVNKTYLIKGSKVDINLLNSSHQSVKNLYRKKPNYEIILETHPLIIQQELNIERLEKYLLATESIESNSREVRNLAKKLIVDEKNEFRIINNLLDFTRSIECDGYELSIRRFEGETTKSAVNTIRSMKGDCSECTNVFIALCRAIGIPAKFILGKTSKNLYHTWAEVYIQGVGWIPVEARINIPIDINKGYFGITNKHIKIFEGVDFEEIGINLDNLDIDLKVVNKEGIYD